jgi:predicted PurR-regulated permease PerM
VAAASLVFAWILWPFSGAIRWATVLGILFAPLYRRILRSLPGWHNLVAMMTLLIIVTMVILPLTLVVSLLIREATGVYNDVRSGDVSFGLDFNGSENPARLGYQSARPPRHPRCCRAPGETHRHHYAKW